MFKIDFNRLVVMLLPTFLRQPTMIAWLLALLSPVIAIYNLFTGGRILDLFYASIDSTTPRLEYMLNYIFYPEGLNVDYNGRIKIETLYSRAIGDTAIYLGGITQISDENKPLYIENEPIYLYSLDELGNTGIDFIISIPPAAQPYDMVRLRALVESFCLPDKTFNIINL